MGGRTAGGVGRSVGRGVREVWWHGVKKVCSYPPLSLHLNSSPPTLCHYVRPSRELRSGVIAPKPQHDVVRECTPLTCTHAAPTRTYGQNYRCGKFRPLVPHAVMRNQVFLYTSTCQRPIRLLLPARFTMGISGAGRILDPDAYHHAVTLLQGRATFWCPIQPCPKPCPARQHPFHPAPTQHPPFRNIIRTTRTPVHCLPQSRCPAP